MLTVLNPNQYPSEITIGIAPIITLLTILLFCPVHKANSQETSRIDKNRKSEWSKKDWRKANTARFAFYMGRKSKNVIRFMNLARLNGPEFSRIYIEPLERKTDYERTLIRTLNRQKPKALIRPSLGLKLAAMSHAYYSGFSGHTGHDGFNFRLKLFSPFNSSFTGENCEYGSKKALDIAVNLLVDFGVPGLGHRKNILDENFVRAGVSSFYHSQYGTNSVTDFSGPNMRDLLFHIKPDQQFIGIDLGIGQISDRPFADIGLSYLICHLETKFVKVDAGYKFGILHNGLHGVDLELGHGHSMGLAGWLLGVNIQSYFPTGNFNLYVQPKLSVFLPLNLFSSGYLWQLGEMERPAIYQLSYGYNFQVTNTTATGIYKHQVTLSRFINMRFKNEEDRKKRRR